MNHNQLAIIVEDTSLRDGEQAPGIALSCAEKMEIAKALDSIGVPMIEVGTAAMGGAERSFIEKAVSYPFRSMLVGWNRANLDDIKTSLDCGLRAIHIGAPTSDIQLRTSLKRDRMWLWRKLPPLIEYCKSKNVFVSVSAEDASRTPSERIIEYATIVRDSGADRIRLSDTLGLFNPLDYHDLVKTVVQTVGIDVQLHTHNDFGLAMGNVMAGVRAGARYVHATVNGWGERVGLASLELVAVGLKRLLGIDTGIELKRLPSICELVARLYKRQIPAWQPIVGKEIFIHESGIHAAGTKEHTESYEPFPPEWIESEHRLVAGKHSGSTAIAKILGDLGVQLSREEAAQFLPSVRSKAIEVKRWLTNEELLELYKTWKQ